MNWKLIFLLSLFGLALGIASVFTFSPTVEFVFWIAATLIIAVLVAKYANGKYFLHGFMVAVVNTFWVTLAQAAVLYLCSLTPRIFTDG